MRISVADREVGKFSPHNHVFMQISDMLDDPEMAIARADLQHFAKITPQYPGVRAPLDRETCATWSTQLSPHLDDAFGYSDSRWGMQAWYSIVTERPDKLIPMQCFPHVDGTDPNQLAMMLYLDRTDHGGTAFFRHRSTGLEALTEENFPHYRDILQADVSVSGLPPACYVTDGAPHFEQTHVTSGTFNHAVFYRGNVLHSGVINNNLPLPADPQNGRLTINAFLRRR